MTHVRMHLYPPQLPTRLRVEIATAVDATGASRPVDVPQRARRHPLDPPFPGGEQVDVLLEASAYAAAPHARDTRVHLAIGDGWSWTALVSGRRIATRVVDCVTVSTPEVIDAPIPIAFETAYGGGTTITPEVGSHQLERDLEAEHLYPRNPFGAGYRLDASDGIWGLPQVEDPEDLLTGGRLEQIADEGWLSAPLPWCLDEVHTATFPRAAMIAGMGPDIAVTGELAEIRRGFLATPPPAPDSLTLDPRFLQDAPPWGWLAALRPEDVIVLEGCQPRGATFAARAPAAPSADLAIEGRVVPLELRACRLVVRPELGDVLVVWLADVALPRPFVPGLHRRIPIEVRLEGAEPVPYPTPVLPSRPPRSI